MKLKGNKYDDGVDRSRDISGSMHYTIKTIGVTLAVILCSFLKSVDSTIKVLKWLRRRLSLK